MDAHLVTLLADAIGAVVRGEHTLAAGYVERALKALKGQQTLPGMPAPAPEAPKVEQARREAAFRIFAYWQRRCGKGATSKLTQERGRAVVARLRDGYTEAEIRKAIDGAATSAYVNQESGLKYDDLELICRNGTKLESFIARGEASTGPVIVETVDASSGGLEEQIAALRRKLATLHRDGRATEYDQASAELRDLMAKRKRDA